MSEITCYFSPQSGYAYLGHDRFRAIAAEHRAAIRWKPVDIVKVFAANDTTAPARQAPARVAYRRMDMARTAALLDLPLNATPPFWPTDTLPACRMIVAAELSGADPAALVGAILSAIWARDLDISAIGTLVALAGEVGLDGTALRATAETPGAAAALEANTAEAIVAGVFGSPTYVFDEELFWGQDRLDLLSLRLKETAW
jgi:2-hydroxychromene-2-carboxylate isomerase